MAGWVGEHVEGCVGDVGTVVQEACAQSFGTLPVPLELLQALHREVHVHLHRHRFGRPGGGVVSTFSWIVMTRLPAPSRRTIQVASSGRPSVGGRSRSR